MERKERIMATMKRQVERQKNCKIERTKKSKQKQTEKRSTNVTLTQTCLPITAD